MSQSQDHRRVMTRAEECARKATQTAPGSNPRLKRSCSEMSRFAIAIVLTLLSLPAAAQQGQNRNDFRVIAPHDWTLLPPDKTNDRRFVSPRRDAWLSLYASHVRGPDASHVRGPVSSHFHRWGVNAGDQVTYQRQGQGWNVVSGYTADNRIFYRKTMLACGGQQWHNLEFEYPASDKTAMDEFVTRASHALKVYRSVGCG
jgi:hypothetical protein